MKTFNSLNSFKVKITKWRWKKTKNNSKRRNKITKSDEFMDSDCQLTYFYKTKLKKKANKILKSKNKKRKKRMIKTMKNKISLINLLLA